MLREAWPGRSLSSSASEREGERTRFREEVKLGGIVQVAECDLEETPNAGERRPSIEVKR
jgi:hypothetical protein